MRTVRSAARARNRPRSGLACLLIVVFVILIALTAHAAAAEDAGGGGGADDPDADPADTDPADAADAGEADTTLSANRTALDGAGADHADYADPADAAIARAELGFAGAAGFADPGELFDTGLRHQRPSRWGRLDLAVTWRRKLADGAANPARADELWLLAIWSR